MPRFRRSPTELLTRSAFSITTPGATRGLLSVLALVLALLLGGAGGAWWVERQSTHAVESKIAEPDALQQQLRSLEEVNLRLNERAAAAELELERVRLQLEMETATRSELEREVEALNAAMKELNQQLSFLRNAGS